MLKSIFAQFTELLGYKPEEIRQDYTGYQKDDESGLEFAQARYYNNKHGRFTSVDPLVASANVKDPQTFNRYSYAMNSPYKFTDPLGLISQSSGGSGFCGAENSSCGDGEGEELSTQSIDDYRAAQAEEPNAQTAVQNHEQSHQQAIAEETSTNEIHSMNVITDDDEEPPVVNGWAVGNSETRAYNCMAWALGITNKWIQPGPDYGYTTTYDGTGNQYPDPVQMMDGSSVFPPKFTFAEIPGEFGGKKTTSSESLKPDKYRIIIIKDKDPKNIKTTHVMRQEADGTWSSKNGDGKKFLFIKDPIAFYNTHYNNNGSLDKHDILYFKMPKKLLK